MIGKYFDKFYVKSASWIFVFLILVALHGQAQAGTLSCSVTNSCSNGTVLFRLYNTVNSQAELPSQTNYPNLVCCTGVENLGNSCSGINATVLKLSGITNAHVEQNSQNNYANNACISVGAGSVAVGYQDGNCSGYDTTIASISGITNAHAGNGNAFTTKICGTAAEPQTLSFSVSDNSIGFGTLSPSISRYATGDTLGSTNEVGAHNFSAATNATGGYMITVRGATLTHTGDSQYTVAAIGQTNTIPSPGAEQFGLRITVNSGTGSATAPYAASGFAYAASAGGASQIASGIGDKTVTIFSARYLANIASSTEAGTYSTTLNFVATGTF